MYKALGLEIQSIKKEYNIENVKQVKPLQVTSFMPMTSSQLKLYEERTKDFKEKRKSVAKLLSYTNKAKAATCENWWKEN